MSLRTLEYALTESVVGIRRNSLMSIASVVTITLSLSILGAFALLVLGLNDVAASLLREFEICVYMDENATEVQVADAGSQLRSLPHVASVQLIEKEAAWENMKADLAEDVELTGIEGNPLPDMFSVRLDDPRHTVSLAKSIKRMPYVETVREGRDTVVQVVKFADLLKLVGAGAAGGLFLIAAFIISNTIRLTLYARRREINIMQMVGATNWFIRLPFVLEGMILGAVGGGIAFLAVTQSSRQIGQAVSKVTVVLAPYSSHVEPLYFLAGMVLLGCLVGAMGSLISIRRFLTA